MSTQNNSIQDETFGPVVYAKELEEKQAKPDLYILDEYFGLAFEAVSEICLFGASKHGKGSFVSYPLVEYEKALRRHQTAKARGELLDKETGKPHSWHIACNAMMIAEIEERNKLADK